MAQTEPAPEPKRPHRVIAERVKEIRKARGLSGDRLAREMTKAGVKWDRSIVANLENGRRSIVTVEELLALAYILDVAPVHLMVPLDMDSWYAVTPASYATTSGRVRAWIRGLFALEGHTDERKYFSEVPNAEWTPPRTLSPEESEHILQQMVAEGLLERTRIKPDDSTSKAVYDSDSGQIKWVKADPGESSPSDQEEERP